MSTYKNQKVIKPKPEDVAGDFLDTEKTAAMLNFVEFIRGNKIGIRWASSNSWTLHYKGKRLGYLKIFAGKPNTSIDRSWTFCHVHNDFLSRYYSMEDCDLKTFIFDNIYAKTCGNCICYNNMNARKAGYMKPTKCGCYPLRIFNPDNEILVYTKQLIEYKINCILEESNKNVAFRATNKQNESASALVK